MDRPPDNLIIDFEIAMCHCIAHLVGKGERQFWVMNSEVRIVLQHIIASLAKDLQIAYDCILH